MMIKVKINNEYTLKLIKSDIENTVLSLEMGATIIDDKVVTLHKYFSRVITEDSKVDTLVFGSKIKDFIDYTLSGFYGTKEGYFVTKNDAIGASGRYYGSSDKSEISANFFDASVEYEGLVKYDPIDLYDIYNGYKLNFKVKKGTDNNIKIYHIRVIKDEAYYKLGEETFIYNLYKGLSPLNNDVETYKQSLIKAIQSI